MINLTNVSGGHFQVTNIYFIRIKVKLNLFRDYKFLFEKSCVNFLVASIGWACLKAGILFFI
jgi:hypothetical protein